MTTAIFLTIITLGGAAGNVPMISTEWQPSLAACKVAQVDRLNAMNMEGKYSVTFCNVVTIPYQIKE